MMILMSRAKKDWLKSEWRTVSPVCQRVVVKDQVKRVQERKDAGGLDLSEERFKGLRLRKMSSASILFP